VPLQTNAMKNLLDNRTALLLLYYYEALRFRVPWPIHLHHLDTSCSNKLHIRNQLASQVGPQGS